MLFRYVVAVAVLCGGVAGSVLAEENAMTNADLTGLLSGGKTLMLGGKGQGYEGSLTLNADGTGKGSAKTDAGAFHFAGFGAQPVEGLEELAQPVGRDARSLVADAQAQPTHGMLMGRQADATLFTVVLDRVRREVQEDLVQLALKGDYASAYTIHAKYYPLFAAFLKLATNPIPIKTAMALAGHCSDELRLPLVGMEKEKVAELTATLKKLGIIA